MRQLVLVLALLVAGCGQNTSDQEQEAKQKQDRSAWRKLSKGLYQEKVRGLLGEPMKVEDQEGVTCWYYQQGEPLHRDDKNAWMIPRGALLFSRKDAAGPKLSAWREP